MKKITIQNMDGSKEEVDLVTSFNVKDLNRNFVILSKGETIKPGMSKVYISEVIEDAEESSGNLPSLSLIGITDETVWDKVKMAMKEIVQGG